MCLLMCVVLLAVSMPVWAEEDSGSGETVSYEAYLEQLPSQDYANQTIELSALAGQSDGEAILRADGEMLVWENAAGGVTWSFEVTQAGRYELEIDYLPLEGDGVAIERTVWIDGQLPYREAYGFSLSRRWVRKSDEIQQDNQGNDIRPGLVEEPQEQRARVRSADGLYQSPLSFYLSAGTHTLTLRGIREPVGICALRLAPPEQPAAYAPAQEAVGEVLPTLKLQAEEASAVSDQTLYPLSDTYNSYTEPFTMGEKRINYIGGYNWRMPGQWIEWEFDVEQAGYYQLIFRAQQNYLVGLPVTRRISVDGAVPCAEMESVAFPYSNAWYAHTVMAGEEPALIYLSEGTHTLRMEVNLGGLADIVRVVRQVASELTTMYYKVIMITGTVPDIYRDYQLERRIEGIVETFESSAALLRDLIAQIQEMAGGKVAEIQLLDTMAIQLESLARDCETLPSRLDNFRENFSGLSSWVLSITEQPLDIDYIVLADKDYDIGQVNPNFAQKVRDTASSFVLSFMKDYSNLGNVYDQDEAITVWAALGQEQAATLKVLIDESFTPETGIAVNLNILSATDALLYAASEGNPPEVVIGTGGALPVDYGIRTALVDFTEFEDYPEVASWFYPSAIAPFTYEGQVFGLPLTQSFPLLFYRTDIFDDLGLEVPQTWDDVYAMIAHLQEHNLTMGPGGFFDIFLLQNGGTYYTAENDACVLDSAEEIKAFEAYTQLYTHYGLPQEYDFFNRFRTGEMPVGIADYTTYNTLAVAAPEIKGLWSVAQVPGVLQPDGTIDRSVSGGSSACIMFADAEHREEGWIFLKWFLSEETQIAYGRELEAVLGSGARHATANVAAMDGLGWPMEVYEVISAQWKETVGIPVIPGSYYVSRHLNNAFREVVSLGELPREALTKYVDMINSEIRKKREEFGLPIRTEVYE